MRIFKNRVVRDSGIKIYNPLREEVDTIKESLTFDNPKYLAVKKFSKWSNTRVPRYLQYYEDFREGDSRVLRVPYGFDFKKCLNRNFYVYDNPPKNKAHFPSFLLNLRETQREASESFLKKGKGLIILPTGKGKSILGIYIASRLGLRTLVIVHKNDLIDGWKKDAKLCFGEDFEVGLIKAQKREVRSFTLATVQSLSRMPEEELDRSTDMFDFVIQDECHRSPAPTFAMVDKFNAKHKLGLTATLEIGDGLAHMINLYFGDVVYKYEISEDEQDILPVEVIPRELPTEFDPYFKAVFYPATRDRYGNVIQSSYYALSLSEKGGENCVKLSDPILAGKKKDMIDFTYHDLDTISVLSGDTIDMVMSDVLSEYREEHSCVLFFSQKAHLEAYLSKLIELGVPSEHIVTYYGSNSEETNRDSLSRAESGEARITLTTYAKAGEGTNCKSWEVAFLISSTSDGKKVEQAAGRVRRTKIGKIKTARLYDYNYAHYVLLDKHYPKRVARYSRLGFSIKGQVVKKPIFSLGFKR